MDILDIDKNPAISVYSVRTIENKVACELQSSCSYYSTWPVYNRVRNQCMPGNLDEVMRCDATRAIILDIPSVSSTDRGRRRF
jgi:hypothetical protein